MYLVLSGPGVVVTDMQTQGGCRKSRCRKSITSKYRELDTSFMYTIKHSFSFTLMKLSAELLICSGKDLEDEHF